MQEARERELVRRRRRRPEAARGGRELRRRNEAHGEDYGQALIDGPGGTLEFAPFTVTHGNIDALGFRFDDIVYLPDVSAIPEDCWPMMDNLRCWIVDALRRDPHPTHSHLAQTLEWVARVAPQTAVLTNMHNDLDYRTVAAETPDHIQPAYDGLTLHFPLPHSD